MMKPTITPKTRSLRERFAANRSLSDSWDMPKKKLDVPNLGLKDSKPTHSSPNCFVPATNILGESYTRGSLLSLAENATVPAFEFCGVAVSPTLPEPAANMFPFRKAQTEPDINNIPEETAEDKRKHFTKGPSISVDTGLMNHELPIPPKPKTKSFRIKVKPSSLHLKNINQQNVEMRGRRSPPPFRQSSIEEDDNQISPVKPSSRKSSASRRTSGHVTKPCGFDRPLITVCFELTPSSSPTSSKKLAYDASVVSSQAQWNTLKMSDGGHQFLHPDGK